MGTAGGGTIGRRARGGRGSIVLRFNQARARHPSPLRRGGGTGGARGDGGAGYPPRKQPQSRSWAAQPPTPVFLPEGRRNTSRSRRPRAGSRDQREDRSVRGKPGRQAKRCFPPSPQPARNPMLFN